MHSVVGNTLKRTFLCIWVIKKRFQKDEIRSCSDTHHWTAIRIRVGSTIEMYYVAVYSHNHSVTITNVLSRSRWWSWKWLMKYLHKPAFLWVSKICLMSNLLETQIQGMKTIIWVKFPFFCWRHCLKNHNLANLAGFNEIYEVR